MKKVKRSLSLILCLMVCVSLLASCGNTGTTTSSSPSTVPSASTSSSPAASPSASAEDVKYADNLNVIIDNTKIAVVNPLVAGTASSATGWVFRMIYDRLVEADGKGGYLPYLAKSWDTTDWKTITFKLRDDIKFSNGDKFTAADVVYTVQEGQKAVGSPASANWTQVESVKALDDYTVQFVCKKTYPQFLFDVSQYTSGIVNSKAIAADPDKGVWIGTGSWIITDFNTNDFVSLKRNDNYWGKIPQTKTMTLKFIPEEATRLMMLQNGESDICFSINPQDLPTIEQDTEHYKVFKYTAMNNVDLGFNMNDPVCGDLNFRMAVASALNRSDIVKAARGDYGIPETTGTFWGSATPYRNNDIPIIPNDLDQAKKYLAASSYKGQEIELVAAISDCINAAQVIQQQLSLIGIKITIKQTDPGSIMQYATYKDNKCQMFCFIAAFSVNPYMTYGVFYPGGMQNRASYNNPEIAKMYDDVVTVSDPAKQQEAYYNIQKLVAKDIPYLNLFNNILEIAALKGVDGLVLSSDSGHDLRYMYKVVG